MSVDALMMAASRIVAVLVMLATAICVSRIGPGGQGMYFLGMTFCGIVVQFSTLGLHNSQVYQWSRDRNSLPLLVGNILAASTIVSALVGGMILAVSFAVGWADANSLLPLLLGAAIVPARMFFTLGSSLLITMNRVRAFNLSLLLNNVLVFGAAVIVTCWRPSVESFLVGTLLATLISAGLLFRFLRSKCSAPIRIDVSVLRDAIAMGFSSYLVCLLTFLVMRLNVFLLEQFSGAESVGQYSIAIQIMDVLLLVPGSFNLILFPRLVESPELKSRLTWQSIGTITVVMTVSLAATVVLAGPMIGLLYGEAFASANVIVVSLLPATVFASLVNVIQPYFGTKKVPAFMVYYWSAGVLVLLVSSCWLIPHYAESGAGWSLSTAYGAVFLLFASKFLRAEYSLHSGSNTVRHLTEDALASSALAERRAA